MLAFLACLLSAVGSGNAFAEPSSATERPNFVFILSDGQGWTGLSVAMHDALPNSKSDFCRTPHLEKLAEQSMRFPDVYAPAPVCSPTRYSLQTR
jgi:arylsulfatase A-like enzyme